MIYITSNPAEFPKACVFTANLHMGDVNIQLARLVRERDALRTAFYGNGCGERIGEGYMAPHFRNASTTGAAAHPPQAAAPPSMEPLL